MIGKALDLKRGGDRFIHTAAYGHFGRNDRPDVFTWEKVLPLKVSGAAGYRLGTNTPSLPHML